MMFPFSRSNRRISPAKLALTFMSVSSTNPCCHRVIASPTLIEARGSTSVSMNIRCCSVGLLRYSVSMICLRRAMRSLSLAPLSLASL